jgi:hypothetical protein
MRAEVVRHGGAARRELARGLVLVLGAESPGWWVLSLSRPATMPSDKEIEIVRAAFGVPGDVPAIPSAECEVVIRWRP